MNWLYSAPAPVNPRDCADLARVDMIPEGNEMGWHDDSNMSETGTDDMSSRPKVMASCDDGGKSIKAATHGRHA